MAKQTATATPAPAAGVTDVSNVTPIAEGAAAPKRRGAPSGPRGPVLVWNDARNLALVESFKAGATTPDLLAAALQSHAAFEGEKSPITAAKVRLHVGQLRKVAETAGVPFPMSFGRGARKREIDIAGLSALLAG